MSTQPLHFQNVVLNAIAGAGDAALSGGHILQITDCPDMDIRTLNVPLGAAARSLIAIPSSVEVTWTVTNSAFYQLSIAQAFIGEGTTVEVFEFTADASATDVEISNAFRAMIALNQNLSVTLNAVGSATLQITASGTDSSLLTVTVPTGNATSILTLYAQVAIASNTTATPSVITTGAAHGLVVGDTVELVSLDQTKLVDGTYVVASIPLATTLTLQTAGGVALAGVATTTGTLDKVPQFQRGNGQQLIDAGVTDAVAGNTYTSWTFQASNVDPTSNQGSEISSDTQVTLYLNEGDAQFAALQAQIISLLTTAGVI